RRLAQGHAERARRRPTARRRERRLDGGGSIHAEAAVLSHAVHHDLQADVRRRSVVRREPTKRRSAAVEVYRDDRDRREEHTVTRRHMLRLTTAGMAAAATSTSLTGQGQTPPPSPSLRHLGATPAGFAVRNKLPGWDI